MYQNFIWDFDGTLFNTYPKMLKAYVKTMQYYQISITPSAIYRTLKTQSSKDLANQYQLDFEEFDQIYKQFEKSDTSNVFAYDDAKYILEKVIEKGGKNYLLTHRENASAKALLQGSQLDGLFVEIVGPENKFPRKPDPTSLLYLVEKYQMEKTKTVMIGDRPMDIDAGINAGVQSIFYNDERLFKIKQAHHQVHSLTEIEKFLDE